MSFSGREWENTTRKRKSQIFLSRLPQPQPVSKTDGDHRSIAPFRGKGGSEGAMHRAGRDPRPVPVSVLAHTKRDTPVADKIAAVLHNSFAASIKEITKELSV
jgi:hypothetical protein